MDPGSAGFGAGAMRGFVVPYAGGVLPGGWFRRAQNGSKAWVLGFILWGLTVCRSVHEAECNSRARGRIDGSVLVFAEPDLVGWVFFL